MNQVLYLTAFNKHYYSASYNDHKFKRDLKGHFDGISFVPAGDEQLEDLSKYTWIQMYTMHNGEMFMTSHGSNKRDLMDNLEYEYARVFGEVQTTLF